MTRDEDVVAARQRARQVAELLGVERQGQTKLATAVSEMARNAVRYAGAGSVEFAIDLEAGMLTVTIADQGPGIPHLQSVLDGTYTSKTGMGLGIVGTRRLVDTFAIESTAGRGHDRSDRQDDPAARACRWNASDLARIDGAPRAAGACRRWTRCSTRTTSCSRHSRSCGSVRRSSRCSTRSCRIPIVVCVALYAELDEKAEHLQRADAMKSKFLSNMTHEFQTPLNSILALTRLLLERTDGDLEPEQEKQVRFIRDATEQLSELVSDLLDIAKVEAGKVTIRPASFTVAELFGALRGLMRPLQQRDAVSLVFESADGLPPLFTDEGKVSQVLRNYISNALKFTEAGEVRVTASVDVDGMVVFRVRDTGIGIAPTRPAPCCSRSSARFRTACSRRCAGPGSASLCRSVSRSFSAGRSA